MCFDSLSCWKVNLLPVWMLWTEFSLRLSLYFGALSFFSILMSPSVPATEKHTHSITLYFWDGTLQVISRTLFPSNISLGIEVHQNRESCFSQSESSLGAFLLIPGVFSCVYTEERIEFGHTAIKPRSEESCSDVCPSVGFSYLHMWKWHDIRLEWPSGSSSPF